MKEFMKDYGELCKENKKFYKKHWKGAVLLNVAVLGAEVAWIFRKQIKESVKEKFHKEENEAQ